MQLRQRLQIAIIMLVGLITIVGLSSMRSGNLCRPNVTNSTCDTTDPELTRLIR